MLDLWITQLEYYNDLYKKDKSVKIPIFFKSSEVDNINMEIEEYFKTKEFMKYIKRIVEDEKSNLDLIIFLNKNWKEENGYFKIDEKEYIPLYNTGILFNHKDSILKYPENSKYLLFNLSNFF
jgi:hypothetical protein